MKKVLSNNIATSVRQPYTKVTHEWYNAMIAEMQKSLGLSIFGSANFIVLWGCINSDSPDADISAGAIWYNGEIYQCDAFVDSAISNDIVGTITTSYDALDPILFTDNNSYNVHQDKKIVWSDSTSGSGSVDYNDIIFSEKEGTYIPTVDFYDASNVLISSDVFSSTRYRFSFVERKLFISIITGNLTIPATTNYMIVSLPVSIPTSKFLVGSAYVDLFVVGGAVYNSNAYIDYSSTGTGTAFNIRRISKADYGSIPLASIQFVINMQLV